MSLMEVKEGDLDRPACHVCGAIMVPAMCAGLVVPGHFKCRSCGATTSATEPEERN